MGVTLTSGVEDEVTPGRLCLQFPAQKGRGRGGHDDVEAVRTLRQSLPDGRHECETTERLIGHNQAAFHGCHLMRITRTLQRTRAPSRCEGLS